MSPRELPVPDWFEPEAVGRLWRVPYQERAAEAAAWAERWQIPPAAGDQRRVGLLLIDAQCTFCIPEFELFVGGRSGSGAVDDTRRLCRFLYRNLAGITTVVPTLDTHRPLQIFHAVFLVDADGRHPPPYGQVTADELRAGIWRPDPRVCGALGLDAGYVQRHLEHYAAALERGGKYALTVWPYHAMLGGIGHALVPALEEAIFFHSLARTAQPLFQIKGDSPLTESYSALGPEVLVDPDGEPIAARNDALLELLLGFDRVIVAGQAKSHCVAWTVEDLAAGIRRRDPTLAGRFYLLEDCTSPVVVPGAADYTADADRAFERFAEAGMHRVRSNEPVDEWPGWRQRR